MTYTSLSVTRPDKVLGIKRLLKGLSMSLPTTPNDNRLFFAS